MGDAILTMLGTMGDPGAVGLVALLGVGLFVCFLGHRHQRLSMGLAGLVVGAELAGRLAMAQGWGTTWTVAVGLLGGAALCALFAIYSYLGVFGLGAVLAASLVGVAAKAAGQGSMTRLALILACLVGGFGALLMRQPVVVVATALYGGLMAMASLFTVLKGRDVRAAVRMMVTQQGAGDVALFLLCVAVLVTGGIVVQFRFGKGAKGAG